MILFVYGLTMFLSAALLFSVQPMLGRMVLPLLGGAPAVWSTCMLFFQAMLLAGYGYAHLSTRILKTRQRWVHCGVILVPLLLLPINIPADTDPPTDGSPILWLLVVLATGVGLPFFVVSTTSSVVQYWFATTSHRSADDPYFLYSTGNLGSLLALLGYPLLIEPQLRLADQAVWWSRGYVILVGLVAISAYLAGKLNGDSEVAEKHPADGETSVVDSTVTRRDRLWWVALSFAPSSWMLGVTTWMTVDLTPMPLLWMIPLATYLLTFILVFARWTLIPHDVMLRLLPFSIALLLISLTFETGWQHIVIHMAAFFVGAMVCHGQLARRRPSATHLTEYYVWMSVGGVLGGLFNSFAPVIFSNVYEYPLTIMYAVFLQSTFLSARERSAIPAGSHRTRRMVSVDCGLIASLVAVTLALRSSLVHSATAVVFTGALVALVVLTLCYLLDRPKPFAVVTGVILIAHTVAIPNPERVIYTERTFFGLLRVTEDKGGFHSLLHGRTNHGVQAADALGKRLPLSYYHSRGPLGDIFAVITDEPPRPIAAVGLGTGTAICYQKPGQRFTFYEIDPAVKRIAETPELFTYLTDVARGPYEVILGDGRLRLSDAPDGSYRLIILDAFSSDAIPIHLLTREALAVYRRKLTDDGLLAFHVSNKYIELRPVVAGLAVNAGMLCYGRVDGSPGSGLSDRSSMGSTWVVLAAELEHLKGLSELRGWSDISDRADGRVWTDDFSSVVPYVKWLNRY